MWSFFILELDSVLPLSNEIDYKNKTETIFLDHGDNYVFKKKAKAIKIDRYLGGSIAIVCKASYFNSLLGGLDGHFALHEKYNETSYIKTWKKVKHVVEKNQLVIDSI